MAVDLVHEGGRQVDGPPWQPVLLLRYAIRAPNSTISGGSRAAFQVRSGHSSRVGGDGYIMRHIEGHRAHRVGWLRAAVLAPMTVSFPPPASSSAWRPRHPARAACVVAGIAWFVAGAMSMAAGEVRSVSSQSDTERADLGPGAQGAARPSQARARRSPLLRQAWFDAELATQVATQLMAQRCARRARPR